MSFKESYLADLKRYTKIEGYLRRFHYYFRKEQSAKGIMKYWYHLCFSILKRKRGLEIHATSKIAEGLYLGHPYNITINPNAVIGKNCNIHKGALIGQENRGKRKGAPVIGDNVWIGINAVVVGSITIGKDVLIAPNSYVNCDVPSHSVVFGNPCVIKHKENATEGYINNII